MLPAYVANMTPIFFRKVNFLNYPLDFNMTYNGYPLLGKNKTFRGLVFGTVFALVMAFVQHLLSPTSLDPPGINYSHWFWLGLLLGFGALFGDALKSFFKRRLGIRAGVRFIPWDQLDYSLGAMLFVSFVYLPPWEIVVTAVIASFFLHIIVTRLAYWSGVREEKW
jgi:CDP-2,3-bis-(O-geranylgeranyl)-sn-glycerol synthase